MSNVAVIGATGHIGSFLVPRLVRSGHHVVAISRGHRAPYVADAAWDDVERIVLDREGDPEGFPRAVADLGADVVVDLTSFTEDDARTLVEALRGRAGHLVHCGTIWVHGPSLVVPTSEDDPRGPIGEYGTRKAAIEDLLLAESARADGLPATVLRAGHITGPGWPVITPLGNLDATVWERLAAGEPLTVPDLGLETLHHVHADDVAQAFALAIERPDVAAGRVYNVVSPRAMSVRGLAEGVASWFGRTADLRPASWDAFRASTTPEHADTTFEHVRRSHAMSIDRAATELGYAPGWTSLEALADALVWLADHGQVDLGGSVPEVVRTLAAGRR
ncbi:NAD(P)-dependent oxidoreductase [Curtobacterium sp. MCBD17_028]|uniref:NAD-dependent epimerase/dehydratase family protein n=1 Tax=Curtobacterium sp. MCBD17_028 TaxID=2175670 RepID=UPI000DA9C1D8|nr:NAD-dependent epimerase/dehydratase family protein [Curtobacterium sp. MCBD17_028]PZE28197.1 NAD(P)-dependent oxidoreductase [Curtobacterium sp. MCBD17_028]